MAPGVKNDQMVRSVIKDLKLKLFYENDTLTVQLIHPYSYQGYHPEKKMIHAEEVLLEDSIDITPFVGGKSI